MSQHKLTSLDWLAPAELARRWGVSLTSVYGMLVEPAEGQPVPPGKVPAMRVGGQLRVHIAEVEAYERPARPSAKEVNDAARKAARTVRKQRELSAAAVPNHLGDL